MRARRCHRPALAPLSSLTSRGVIDRVGPEVTTLKPGDKVVVSFQIACGTCEYCKKKWSSMCDRTNNSSMMASMYGHRDAGFFGYGHLTGGWPGGQAEYVRVPFGEVNCLKVPEGVTGESGSTSSVEYLLTGR